MADVLPLGDEKYYGTKVRFTAGGEVHELKIWCSDHFAKPFASKREILKGWDPVEDGHDHVEDEQSLKVATIIAKALTKEGM